MGSVKNRVKILLCAKDPDDPGPPIGKLPGWKREAVQIDDGTLVGWSYRKNKWLASEYVIAIKVAPVVAGDLHAVTPLWVSTSAFAKNDVTKIGGVEYVALVDIAAGGASPASNPSWLAITTPSFIYWIYAPDNADPADGNKNLLSFWAALTRDGATFWRWANMTVLENDTGPVATAVKTNWPAAWNYGDTTNSGTPEAPVLVTGPAYRRILDLP